MTLHAKIAMSDSKWYPEKLSLIITHELDIYIYILKTDYLQLRLLCTSFVADENMWELLQVNYLNLDKPDNIFHIIND